MYIGLIDDDLRSRGTSYPNLEIMKLASYHKKNRDLVELVRDYRTYTRYSKLYLRRNGADNDLPALLLSKARDKCEYGGYAFTNGIYVPMEKDIEKSLPDVTIYDKINIENRKFNQWLNKSFMRLETEDTIQDNTRSSFLIYDKNAIQYPMLNEIVNIAKMIEFVEPQYFDSLDDAIWFARQSNFHNKTVINYNGTVTAATAKELSTVEFKNKIRYNLIPDSCKNMDFITGLELLNAYMGQIESVCRLNPKLIIQNTFNNANLRAVVEAMSDDRSIESMDKSLKFILKEKNYQILNTRYSKLYTRIKMLRRYNTHGKT